MGRKTTSDSARLILRVRLRVPIIPSCLRSTPAHGSLLPLASAPPWPVIARASVSRLAPTAEERDTVWALKGVGMNQGMPRPSR